MAMDVHTGESDPRSDPSITAVVPASPRSGQGRLFNDPNGDSFANTDQFPAVPRERRNERGYRAPRVLRAALAVVVVVILAAGAVLALVKTGVIDGTRTPHSSAQSQSSTHTTTPPRNVTHAKELLTPTQTFAGTGSANYTVPAKAFAVTVTAGPGRSWVSIGIVGQQPIFAGILQPNSSQGEILLGPAEVSIGAGGTTVTVQAGHKKQTLLPPSAPFSYQITPAG
jgi:cytoskeletal protein RodZ